MAIKNIIAKGIGFTSDGVIWIPTHGFLSNLTVVNPCTGPRRRPDESMAYRTRASSDESLRRRVSSDESLRTRPPECGNES